MDEVIGRLAAEAADVVERQAAGAPSAPAVPEYERHGRPFAALPDAGTVELRLGAEIAEAARRTPDTHVSERGDDWVRFTPREWDKHAADRLEAWFRVAWRAAAKR